MSHTTLYPRWICHDLPLYMIMSSMNCCLIKCMQIADMSLGHSGISSKKLQHCLNLVQVKTWLNLRGSRPLPWLHVLEEYGRRLHSWWWLVPRWRFVSNDTQSPRTTQLQRGQRSWAQVWAGRTCWLCNLSFILDWFCSRSLKTYHSSSIWTFLNFLLHF